MAADCLSHALTGQWKVCSLPRGGCRWTRANSAAPTACACAAATEQGSNKATTEAEVASTEPMTGPGASLTWFGGVSKEARPRTLAGAGAVAATLEEGSRRSGADGKGTPCLLNAEGDVACNSMNLFAAVTHMPPMRWLIFQVRNKYCQVWSTHTAPVGHLSRHRR